MATRGKRSPGAKRGAGDGAHVSELYRAIYAVVRRIPRGRVATYGQVAELAGIPGGGRVAGAAMKVSAPEQGLPWHRVIGKRSRGVGLIRIHDPVGAGIQRSMLEDEGVTVSDAGSIKLADHGWLPGEPPPRSRTRRKPRRK